MSKCEVYNRGALDEMKCLVRIANFEYASYGLIQCPVIVMWLLELGPTLAIPIFMLSEMLLALLHAPLCLLSYNCK